ncbi:MAG: hypothetical protein JXR40_01715 [Pontiellaceae bacterium]|nr:hypothetical protein [Pontiellaceae bacterium]
MIWIFIAYGLVLIYLATHQDKVKSKNNLRSALICLALIPFEFFLFSAIKMFKIDQLEIDPDVLISIEMWANCILYLLLGISLLFLINALIPKEEWNPMEKE